VLQLVSLARALRNYQRGKSSEVELLGQLDAILGDGRSSPGVLLEILDAQEQETPLPEQLYQAIRSRIELAAAGTEIEDYDATQVATSVLGDTVSSEDMQPRTVPVERPPPLLQAEEPAAGLPGPGDTLNDRFFLEEMVGQGGMSRVFRAIDEFKVRAGSRSPEVAVKLMDISGMAEDNAFMIVQREVQKLQSLSHENIVRVIEGYQDPSGALFITMEYLSGTPLSRKIADIGREMLPINQAMDYIRQIGLALQYAHKQGIVHADFKPSNAFITDNGALKVIDFGIARAFRRPEDKPEDMTVFDPRGLGALTPAYASPEMIEGQDPDPRDDVYSFGCVAYELLTGRHPYSRMQSTEARAEEMTPVRPVGLTRTQWRALQSALALERERRTATVDEFLRGLLPRKRATPWALIGLSGVTAAAIGFALMSQQGMDPITTPDLSPVVPADVPADVPTEVPAEVPAEVEVPEAVQARAPRFGVPDPGTLFKDCVECPEVVVVPEGSVTIGAARSSGLLESESPSYLATFEHRFAIGAAEVTVAQFDVFMRSTRRRSDGCRTVENGWKEDPERSWMNPGFEQAVDHPVTCVSFSDATSYVSWLSEKTGERYRLPSEAEWEYAAKAGGEENLLDPTAACDGINVADMNAGAAYPGIEVFDCDDQFAYTAPTKIGLGNAFRLMHMRGNVFEWTQDCWNPTHTGASADGGARLSGNCDYRVLRGGSWFTAPREQRFSYRNRHGISHRANTFGFRVVREFGE